MTFQAGNNPMMPAGTLNDPYSVTGLLDNPRQLQQLAGNPMFNMGMALLASGQDGNINPFTAVMSGLQQAGEQKRTLEQDERDRQLREALQKYFGAGADGMPGAPMGGAGQPQQQPFSDYFRLGWGDILDQRI